MCVVGGATSRLPAELHPLLIGTKIKKKKSSDLTWNQNFCFSFRLQLEAKLHAKVPKKNLNVGQIKNLNLQFYFNIINLY